MANFEKRNLRSGHLMRPGGVTFGVIGSSFFGNVSNCWLNSYRKFGGATRRGFFAICEKPEGGGADNRRPPAVRGLICIHELLNPHCMTEVKKINKNIYKKYLSPIFIKMVNNTTSNITDHNRFY